MRIELLSREVKKAPFAFNLHQWTTPQVIVHFDLQIPLESIVHFAIFHLINLVTVEWAEEPFKLADFYVLEDGLVIDTSLCCVITIVVGAFEQAFFKF